MSVINKMLRDLDQRQTPAALGGAVVHAAQPATWNRGVHSLPVSDGVGGAAPGSHASTVARLGVGVVLLVGVGLGGWLVWQRVGTDVPATARSVTAALTVAPASVPALTPAQVDAFPLAAISEPVVVSRLATASPDRAPPAPVPTVVASVPASPPVRLAGSGDTATPSTPASVSLRMESTLLGPPTRNGALAGTSAPAAVTAPLAPPVAAPKASPVPTEPPSATQRLQQASADVLLQAQTLWSAGSHAAAMDVLQQSVDAAERAVKTGTSPAGNPALLSLVRELVRMHMAQSQFSVVWDLLVRLEPVLGNQPDLWALRGNTGQRLGRHQDSVAAYRAALQSRPDEPRWLLGCAVSLAALGQAAQAGDMAERARSVGPISREVQVYLQQMGVPLKDK